MSDEPTLAELKSTVLEEWKGLQSDLQAKKQADKEKVISSIISLSAETGQEIKKEELQESNIASLNILEKQFKHLLETISSGEGGEPQSGIVSRSGEPPKLTKVELNNTIIDMISFGFGLPVEDTDEYRELCEKVRMEHYGMGLRY